MTHYRFSKLRAVSSQCELAHSGGVRELEYIKARTTLKHLSWTFTLERAGKYSEISIDCLLYGMTCDYGPRLDRTPTG